MERILITGGCGFIGSNLIAYLSKNGGPKVRVFDNESLGKRNHIAEFNVQFTRGDICDAKALRVALKGVDAVVHLAADTRVIDSIENPEHNFYNNVVGTFNLLKCMRKEGVKRLINASTGGAILGPAVPPVNEKMAPNPLSPYGASKLSAEGYCHAFSGAYGFSAISLRFSNAYGPRSFHKGSVVAHFFKQILSGQDLVVYGDGTQIRDYVFVEDLCAGIKQALESEKSGVYQLGTGRPTSINELIRLIKKAVGVTHPFNIHYTDFRPGELRETWCDVSKARRDLNYEPTVELDKGLGWSWEWYKKVFAKNCSF